MGLNATLGKEIWVRWRLIDVHGQPFGASGIYLRVSRCAAAPLRIPAIARPRGHYAVRVAIPRGGIRKLLVGVKGWRIVGTRRERADAYFQFNPPLRATAHSRSSVAGRGTRAGTKIARSELNRHLLMGASGTPSYS